MSLLPFGILVNSCIKSYIRSKRFYVFLPIYLFLGLLSVILIQYGLAPKPEDVYQYTSQNLNSFVSASALLAGVFAGDAISRDFSKEGFFTLTQPVSRTEIFFARLTASLCLCLLIMFSSFYLLGLSYGYYLYGIVVPNIYLIILFGILFQLSINSFALLFSSIFKSSVVSILVTTIVIIFAIPAVSGLIQFINIEPWFFLNYAGNVIQNLAMKNYPPHYQEMSFPVNQGRSQFTIHMYSPTIVEALAIIIGYAIVSIFLGVYIYKRRELTEVS